jgi:aspartyl-tRNA(Asn)/glutamyl-tRNA(Gln) amidotransferase subunit B
MSWEAVIGLEVHVQLASDSKIFSGASTEFGAEPNSQASLIDLGMPGTLPVLNQKVLDMALLFGLAIDAEVTGHSVFARKNYFYPDLPKGYQTSQFDHPVVGKGRLTIVLDDGTEKTLGITRAHLEEDAGKSLHEGFGGMTGVDLNRAGTPLLEIVSEPDMRTGEEAVAYLKKLHSIVRYLGISDGNMAEGSMRCDANVSVRPKGSDEFGTRAEIKNVNSFRFVEKAINHEIERQIDLLEDGGTVVQETRLYDADKNETRSMRSKEEADDYRYFPCPDLLPVRVTEADLQQLRSTMPELPDARRHRFTSDYELSAYDAGVLVAERSVAEFFEATVKAAGGEAKLAANWITSELLGMLNKAEKTIDESAVSPEQLGTIIRRIQDGTISSKIAKQVFEAVWNEEGEPDQVIEDQGLKQMSDSGELEGIVDQVLADNAEQVEAYKAADPKKRKKMFGFFVGQVMKATSGKANPQQANALIEQKLEQ